MATYIPPVSLGENSRIVMAGTQLVVQTGSVRENPQEIPTTANITQGYMTRTRGVNNLECDAKCQWTYDSHNPLVGPPTLIPGTTTNSVEVYPDIVNQPTQFYSMPICWVNMATCSIESGGSGGVITFDLSLKSQGEFGTPNRPLA